MEIMYILVLLLAGCAVWLLWKNHCLKRDVYDFAGKLEKGLSELLEGKSLKRDIYRQDDLWGKIYEKLCRVSDMYTHKNREIYEDCGRLGAVEFMDGFDYLRLYEYAFSGCSALRRVTCGDAVWELRVYRDILSEDIPEAVRMIFHSALSCFVVEKEEVLCGYRGLGRIVRIPEGIRRVEAEVFRDVLMLGEITIPDTVEYIGARAFHGTAWMEKQRSISPTVVVNHMLLDGSGCEGEVVIPEDIRLICGWAFAGGMGIESIRFLSDQVKVEAYAFRNCIYLKRMFFRDGSSVAFQGIMDREREFPTAFSALAKQAVTDALN